MEETEFAIDLSALPDDARQAVLEAEASWCNCQDIPGAWHRSGDTPFCPSRPNSPGASS